MTPSTTSSANGPGTRCEGPPSDVAAVGKADVHAQQVVETVRTHCGSTPDPGSAAMKRSRTHVSNLSSSTASEETPKLHGAGHVRDPGTLDTGGLGTSGEL